MEASVGAPGENRTQVRANTQWVLLDRVIDGLAEPLKTTISAASVTHQTDGTFEGTIIAAKPSEVPAEGSWGVYTYAGGATTVNAEQELFVPVNFAAETSGGGTQTEAPIGQNELVWGFKESWRNYVSSFAEGSTVPGAKTEIDENGLFHFTLADASGYDANTGEGVIKYDGRIRFMSSLHGFDIVVEKPWVTFSDGGAAAVLSLGMSPTATVGDLTVSRVDAATLTPGNYSDADGTRTWTAVPGIFVDSVQPLELARYIGESIDPVSFAVPVSTDAVVDPTIDPGVDKNEAVVDEREPQGTPEGDPIESAADGAIEEASGNSAGAAHGAGLANTGANAGAMTAAALGGLLLLAAGIALTARRRVNV